MQLVQTPLVEAELFQLSLCREDWELIMGALRGCSLENLEQARRVGEDSTYGAVLWDRALYMQALASDIEFKLPE